MERFFKSEVRSDREIIKDIIKELSKYEYLTLSEENKFIKAQIDMKKINSLKEREKIAENIIDIVMKNKKLQELVVFLWKGRLTGKKIKETLGDFKIESNSVQEYLNKFSNLELLTHFWLSNKSRENIAGDSMYKNFEKNEGEAKMEEKNVLDLSLGEIIEKLKEAEKIIEFKNGEISKLEEKISKLEGSKEIKLIKKEIGNLNKKVEEVTLNTNKIEEIGQRIKENIKLDEGIKTNTNEALKEIKKITVNKIIKEVTEKQATENKEVIKAVTKALEGIDKRIEEGVEIKLNKSIEKIEKAMEEKINNIREELNKEEKFEGAKKERTMVTEDDINKLFE